MLESQISNSTVSWPVMAVGILYLFLIVVWAIIITLAPYLLFCHNLLMKPKMRRFASLGVVPLAMFMLPFVRQYLLRRYLRGLRKDVGMADWLNKYVLPSNDYKADRFGVLLKKNRRVLVWGPSGIGKTSYLKYLTASYAAKRKKDSRLENLVPLFMPLVLYQTQELQSLFNSQLSHYGQFTDSKLNNWFLKKGGFLILIDGLNEVNPQQRQKIASFVEQNYRANYFGFSSQESYPDFQAAERLELIGLEPEKVREYINKRLDKEKAEYAIKQFSQKTYALYALPQNLEFGLDITEYNNPLPNSRRELYETVVAPTLKLWEQNQRTDYPVMLFSRAYDMLKAGFPFFEAQHDPSKEDYLTPLLRYKILILYGDRYLFRHELIRAYLANKYFSARWQDLLIKDGIAASSHWNSMLEFVILDFHSQIDVREFFAAVSTRNNQLAGDLFKWLTKNHPELCADWSDDFLKDYGKKILELA